MYHKMSQHWSTSVGIGGIPSFEGRTYGTVQTRLFTNRGAPNRFYSSMAGEFPRISIFLSSPGTALPPVLASNG